MYSKKNKQVILSCSILLIVGCICLGLILISGVGVSSIWPFGIQPEEVSPTPVSGMDYSHLPDDLADVIAEIESQVIHVRGLDFTGSLDRTLISIEDLEEIVVNEFFSDYTDQDAHQDVLMFSVLGLLPQGFNLKRFYNDLYSEQISGFYDNMTKELFVVKGLTFGGSEKLTYAHEFTHALQDQTYNLEQGLDYNEASCEVDSERCAAIQALIEGDASLMELLWFQKYASSEDYDDLMRMIEDFSSPILDSAPPFIAADLYFPYEKGLAFVQYLYGQGGFPSVDEAYHSLPLSTEQILHPERYPEDTPRLVTLADISDTLGDAWILLDQNVMGEWYTFLMLNRAYDEAYQLTEAQAKTASEGWGGDAYAFYLNEDTDEVVFILDTVWDTITDAEEFAEAIRVYANHRWDVVEHHFLGQPVWAGSDTAIGLMLEGDRMVWVIAPDEETVEAILMEIK